MRTNKFYNDFSSFSFSSFEFQHRKRNIQLESVCKDQDFSFSQAPAGWPPQEKDSLLLVFFWKPSAGTCSQLPAYLALSLVCPPVDEAAWCLVLDKSL